MQYVICRHGDTAPDCVTVTLERGQTTMVFKSVPAHVCTNCGEAYLDEATTTSLLPAAEVVVKAGDRLKSATSQRR